jgi:hypothetical protein
MNSDCMQRCMHASLLVVVQHRFGHTWEAAEFLVIAVVIREGLERTVSGICSKVVLMSILRTQDIVIHIATEMNTYI